MSSLTLFGAILSPYVRKTRLVLAFKGIEYQHINVIPRSPDQPEEFKQNSPLGKVPLLKADGNYIADSSVICSFLERAYPEPTILPGDNFQKARAQWFEEYADTQMTSVIGGHLFAERVLAKALFKREPIQSDIDLAINEELPRIFDYLSSELKGEYMLGSEISLADIAVCGMFVAMHHCSVECDAQRWPELAAYIERVTQLDFFKAVTQEEGVMVKMLTSQ